MKTRQHLYDVVKRNENKRMSNQQNEKNVVLQEKTLKLLPLIEKSFGQNQF